MFASAVPDIEPLQPDHLDQVDFIEKEEIREITKKLITTAKNPYAASLPLLISAALGDKALYDLSLASLNAKLQILNQHPKDYDEWMRCHSFKAWMQGRILEATMAMADIKTLAPAKNKMQVLLEEKMEEAETGKLAFIAWANGYRAALSKKEYETCRSNMENLTGELIALYKKDRKNHESLSNTLWAFVMNLSAAASTKNKTDYENFKEKMTQFENKMISFAKEKPIHAVLETGLLRTAESNDYPAWALAKVRLASARMEDWELYDALAPAVANSIDSAKKANAPAEYALAATNDQLAMKTERQLRPGQMPAPLPSFVKKRLLPPR